MSQLIVLSHYRLKQSMTMPTWLVGDVDAFYSPNVGVLSL